MVSSIEPADEATEENVFCRDETTRRERDEDVLENVGTPTRRVIVQDKTTRKTDGVSFE